MTYYFFAFLEFVISQQLLECKTYQPLQLLFFRLFAFLEVVILQQLLKCKTYRQLQLLFFRDKIKRQTPLGVGHCGNYYPTLKVCIT